ncbi:MAG: fused MFS/spermidine synthase, partial [Candidatus Eisenbacteria bacterium]
GLVYEIIWTRMLTLVFGNTVYAASTVIASFMGGLALGSFLFGRLADQRRDTLRLYGMLELGVGVFALLMPFILRGLNVVYGGLFRAFGEQPGPFFIARFFLSFALLLLPTILMGATLPVLTRFFVSRRARLGRLVANLYALNTLGATAGCFLAGFFLIEKLGVTASNYAAAATSLIVGGLILLLARRLRRGESGTERATGAEARVAEGHAPPAPPASEGTRGGGYSDRLRRLILVSAALVGFTSLAYEVIWTRVIIYVVTASIEAFAVVLTTYLAGIALGSLLVARWVDRWRRLLTVFGAIEIVIGLAAVASIPLLADLYEVYIFASRFVPPGFWGLTSVRFIATAAVIAIPALLMGAAFPVAVNGFIRSVGRAGRGVGVLYAMNTVGAVAGSLAAGFLLLPTLGAQKGLMAVALLNLLVGVVLLSAEPGRRFRGVAGGAAVAAAGFLLGVVLIPPFAFHGLFGRSRPEAELIYCSEDVTATITVHRYPPGYNYQDNMRVICTTGVDVAGTDSMLRTTQLIQGHLPLLFHEPGPRVLQIGFGSGETSRVVLLEGASSLDAVEICAGLVRAAPLFADINELAYQDPRVRIIIMDAKNYALLTGETYDIIMNDSIHPRVSGNASLYTVDYFADCRRRLAPGGFMSSWFPVYGLRPEELRMIVRSFQTVFPHATMWMAYNMVNRHALLLAPVDDAPLRIDYRDFHRRITRPEIQADLSVIDMNDPVFFISSLVMDEDALREYSQGGRLNTDDHPLLEYLAPKHVANDEFAWAAILESLLPYRSDVRELLVNLPEDPEERKALDDKLAGYFESNGLALRGMAKGLRRDPGSRDEFEAARAITPDHPAVRIATERRENELAHRLQEVRSSPDDPDARVRLGDAYLRAGRFEEAARHLREAVARSEGRSDLWIGLGGIEARLGRDEEAADAYRKALEIAPQSVEALNSLAILEAGMGNHEKAVSLLRRATEAGPNRPEAWNTLAWFLAEKGTDLENALRFAERAVELEPSAPHHDTLAWVLFKRGELERAREAARTALDLSPGNETYRERLRVIEEAIE